jgi:hypothetical protein
MKLRSSLEDTYSCIVNDTKKNNIVLFKLPYIKKLVNVLEN